MPITQNIVLKSNVKILQKICSKVKYAKQMSALHLAIVDCSVTPESSP